LKQTVSAVAFVVFTWLAAASLQAHHSPSAIFDMTKHVAVTGTLTRVNWINPHIVLEMEAGRGWQGRAVDVPEQSAVVGHKSVGPARRFRKAIGQTITVEAVKRAMDRSTATWTRSSCQTARRMNSSTTRSRNEIYFWSSYPIPCREQVPAAAAGTRHPDLSGVELRD
jgi:hypothetical protein